MLKTTRVLAMGVLAAAILSATVTANTRGRRITGDARRIR
jgi:hypothetical protein